MSERVLGFYEKDALKDDVLGTNPFLLWHIEPKKLVPVNLKSESVTLEWLENFWR
jgi:hypothetical protein